MVGDMIHLSNFLKIYSDQAFLILENSDMPSNFDELRFSLPKVEFLEDLRGKAIALLKESHLNIAG